MSRKNFAKYSASEIRERVARGETKTDWDRLDTVSDAEIETQMRSDPDWSDLLDIDWSNAEIVQPSEKQAISIRLDKDVVDFFKAQGKGYQTRINAVLKHYMRERSR
ncbi:MAG: BrnA antitoxin family protein [Rhizobiaceae bacterium]|nr:BrnA antitoxin family protein [Rhizobiaceae bacterium]